MVTQKMISVKLDENQLVLLDSLCSQIGCNRNKLINFAVFMVNNYLRESDKCVLTTAYALGLKEFAE